MVEGFGVLIIPYSRHCFSFGVFIYEDFEESCVDLLGETIHELLQCATVSRKMFSCGKDVNFIFDKIGKSCLNRVSRIQC